MRQFPSAFRSNKYVPAGTYFFISLFLNAVLFIIFTTHGVFPNHPLFSRESSRLTKSQLENIAICFAGNPRTFRLPLVHENIVKNVIQPLKEEYTVSAFFILTLDDAPRSNRTQGVIDNDAVNEAVRKFGHAETIYLKSQGNFDVLRRSNISHNHYEWLDPPAHCSTLGSTTPRLPHTLLRAEQCLQHISEYEKRGRLKFDWIYRLRPDIIFFDKIITPKFLRKDVYYSNQARTNVTHRTGKYWLGHHGYRGDGAVADQMSLSSRWLAETAMRAWDATEDCELYHMGFTASPEDTLRFWLLKHNFRYSAIPFDWAIVRENIGPECKRLFHQHGVAPNGRRANWKLSLKRCFEFGLDHQDLFPYMINVTRYLSRLPDMQRAFSEIVTE